MDQQGRGEVLDASPGRRSVPGPPGVSVYDADGEQLGTVSDWQDKHNFLIVHQGRLFGHDTYIPHTAIRYSDMNGVHLHVRQVDLTTIKQQPLAEQATPVSMVLPIFAPDMDVASVTAMAFADHTTSNPVPSSSSSAQFAVEAAQDLPVQASPLPERRKSKRLWRRSR